MNISNFANQMSNGDYAHSNLFTCAIEGIAESSFMVKATSIPAHTVGTIEVPFQNRKIKVPGDRTFADWTITVINDESFSTRAKLIAWQEQIQNFGNWQGAVDPNGAHKTLVVTPMKRDGGASVPVMMTGWPSEIGAIDLSWETADTIQEYTVTFSVTYSSGV